jgi:hypothetical protein
MGQLLATLEGHHTEETSAAAVSDLPVGYKSDAPATTTTMVMIPSLPVLAAVTPVDCSLHPGQPCVKSTPPLLARPSWFDQESV